jgi:hypothetical protein
MFGSDKCPGLAFLCLRDIFAYVEKANKRFRAANVIITMFQVSEFACTCIRTISGFNSQIYVEQVYDLLGADLRELQTPLQIREDKQVDSYSRVLCNTMIRWNF